jgi:eukaryotic-like serine/threonine-protein kinase
VFGEGVTRCAFDGTDLVSAAEPVDPLLGVEVQGRYTIQAPLGRGGMGRVYRAYQHAIGRDVALKVMSADVQGEAARRRFMREAHLLGQLNHPGIVAAVDFGQLPDGSLFLVMELLEGMSLQQLVRSSGPLAAERVVELGRQLCDALAAAHHRGIVHRDLKPSNLMLQAHTPAGRDVLKVLDFGLARAVNDAEQLTSSGVVMGSAQFMAPELLEGGEPRPSSDLYSVGAILYVLLNGRLPFGKGHSFTTSAQRQLLGQIEAFEPTVSPTMEHLVRRLMSTNPEARPSSAESVRELLGAVLEASPPANHARSPNRRSVTLAAVLGALVVLGLSTAVWVSQRSSNDAATPPPRIVETAVEPAARPRPEVPVAVPEATTAVVAPPEAVAPSTSEPVDAGVPKRVRATKTKRVNELPGEWLP